MKEKERKLLKQTNKKQTTDDLKYDNIDIVETFVQSMHDSKQLQLSLSKQNSNKKSNKKTKNNNHKKAEQTKMISASKTNKRTNKQKKPTESQGYKTK